MKTMRPIRKEKKKKEKQKMKSSSSLGIEFRKESSSNLGRKEEIHKGEIRFRENIKLWAKKEGHQDRKDSNLKKEKRKERERERERERWMQEFSSSCERILIHQKTQETWDSMKDHSSWERWAKMKTHQEQNLIKLRKMRKRKNKTHFIKRKKKKKKLVRLKTWKGGLGKNQGKKKKFFKKKNDEKNKKDSE